METQCMGCMEMYDYDLDACPHCGFKESEYKKIGYHLAPHSTLVDTYVVGKAIGYGGFGVTYVGYNAILEKKVAIKEYLPGEFATRSPGDTTVTAFTGDKEQAYYKGLEQFEQEAKRLAKLKNKDGIVEIFDSFRANNTVYIIMERLEGETLKELIKREKKLSVTKATNIIVAVLEALKEVHEDGIIHRDISPENIFITKSGEVKLIDFGAARNATTGLSKSLSVIVKQGYAPPEQYFSKGKQGTWTDVYATAATYYKMLTGITPDDSMERKGKDSLVPPSKLKVKLGKGQENALLNALELDIKNRTSTVDEFLEELTGDKGKVKRVKVKKEKEDLGKMSLKTKLAIVLGTVVVACAFVIGYQVVRDNIISDQESLANNQVYVPNVLSLSYEEAEALLAKQGLVAEKRTTISSDYVPENIVMKQDIASGQLVEKGTVVKLVTSKGGVNVVAADYVGMSRYDVVTDFDELQLYAEFQEVESALTKDSIVGQNIVPDEYVRRGSEVTFQVSKGMSSYGTGETVVPQFVGMDLYDALKLAEEKKLYLKVMHKPYNQDVPKDQILNQNYSEDAIVDAGTVIQIEVSSGVEIVRMPTCINVNIEDIKVLLETMGIEYEVTYENGFADNGWFAPGYIIGASVEEDAKVPVGSTVELRVAEGVSFNATILGLKDFQGSKDYENRTYSVGEEIQVEVLIDVNQYGGSVVSVSNDFVLDYAEKLLEFKGVEGNATATATNHYYYGNVVLVGYNSNQEKYSERIVLSFVALEKGNTTLSVESYMVPKSDGVFDTRIHTYGGDEIASFDDQTNDSIKIYVE